MQDSEALTHVSSALLKIRAMQMRKVNVDSE